MSELRRAVMAKEFWLVTFTSALGFMQQTPWVVLPLAVLLTLWSSVSDRGWIEKFPAMGELPALAGFWFMSLAQNLLLIGTAFVAGSGTHWIFWQQ